MVPPAAANHRTSSSIQPIDYQAVGHSVFAVGRLLSAIGGLFIRPRRVLLLLYVGVIVASILAMNLSGYSGVAMIILVQFFEVSPFPFMVCDHAHRHP